jgi:hypothetical protein
VFPALEQALKRRALVIIISDFTGDLREIEDGIQRLRHYGHELVLLRPLSPEEAEFPYRGRVLLIDAETQERQLVSARDVRPGYLANLARHSADLTALARKHAADLETFTASDVSIKPLAAYLVKRDLLR